MAIVSTEIIGTRVMDYLKIYNSLIDRARNCACHGYSEKHHIIPKCMGGTNDKSNIVELRPEEHYLAHQLLVKIYPDNRKLVYAAVCMTRVSEGQRRNNKLYGWLKRRKAEIAKSLVPWNKGKKGVMPDPWNKGKILGPNPEHSARLSGRIRGPANPEVTKKIADSNRGRKNKPEVIAEYKAVRSTPEYRKVQSERMKEWHRKRKNV